MCGIAGIYQKDKIDLKVLNQMTDIMIHRGPDDRGVFVNENVGLGHRRLAILDLTLLGHQPMNSPDDRYTIVYNGEIYNFLEIKKELQEKGYKFKSSSDTEVILMAYLEWGVKSLDKLNGMWAFAIYDAKTKKLFACRDRLGIKPLYYYLNGQTLVLASEIKAILEYPGIKAKVDLMALNEYFTFQNIYSDRTLFEGIKLLPPGYFMEFDGKDFKKQMWWDIPVEKEDLSVSQWEEKLRSVLLKSVEHHLISDVEIGSFLSGGMDSATITVLASRANARLKTFTAGFDVTSAQGIEATFDERKNAKEVADVCESDHHEILIESGSMIKVLPELIWHLEDLRMGMCYPNYLVSGLVGDYVKVVLSGAAGDEFFGGYPWRYKLIENDTNRTEFDLHYYNYWSRLVKDQDKKDFFTPETYQKIDFSQPYKEYKQIISAVDNLGPVEKALYFELKTFLHGLLVVEDKVSMAHSIEVRVPFTDLEMIKLACSMPAELKTDGETGKIILRKVMREILPTSISEKKKQGFSAPEGSWYQDKNLEYVKDILLCPRTIDRGYFQESYIQKIIKDHSEGVENHRLIIWSLLSFEWWCRIFIDGEGEKFKSHKE